MHRGFRKYVLIDVEWAVIGIFRPKRPFSLHITSDLTSFGERPLSDHQLHDEVSRGAVEMCNTTRCLNEHLTDR